MKVTLAILLVLVICCVGVNASKPKTLAMLSYIPLTGRAPSRGEACATAQKIAIEAVNKRKRKDVLPDYALKLHFEDQAKGASGAPRGFFNFYDNYTNETENSTTFMAPIVLGPTVACQWIALTLKLHSFTEISEKCAGPLLLDRRLNHYQNLFSVTAPAVNGAASEMVFAKRIGKWSQVAVITFSRNPNEYRQANAFQENAERNGIQILHYASESLVTLDVVKDIKASGARVIVPVAANLGAICLPFLCHSYTLGMRAPQYAFVFHLFCYFATGNPNMKLPEGCTPEMIEEQLKISFFAGFLFSSPQSFGPTSLGYETDWFEEEFNKIHPTPPTDYSWRHVCHDTALAAIVALNQTETELRTTKNMTLSDFHQHPKEIGNLVRNFTRYISFRGLRTGLVTYNDKGEVAFEDMWMGQYQNGEFRILYRATLKPELQHDVWNMSNYDVIQLDPNVGPVWFTKSGNPPKDLSVVETRPLQMSAAVVWSVRAIASILAATQLLAFGCIMVLRRPPEFVSLIVLLLGCLALDASSIVLSMGVGREKCMAFPLLSMFGLLIVDNVIFSKGLVFFLVGKTAVPEDSSSLSSRQRSRQNETKKKMKMVAKLHPNSIARTTCIGFVAVLLLGVAMATIFFVSHPFSVETSVSPVKFDFEADAYFENTVEFCHSPQTSSYILAIAGLCFAQLLAASIFALRFRYYGFATVENTIEAKSIMLAAINAMTMTCAFVLIGVLLSGDIFVEQTFIAFAQIIYSGFAWFIVSWPSMCRRKKPVVVAAK